MNPMRILLLSSCLFVGGIANAANDLPGGGINPEALSQHVRVLASDAFEGRAPASNGEQRTVDYLVKQFTKAGLQPGGANGSWVQEVPLVEITGKDFAPLTITGGKGAPMALNYANDTIPGERAAVAYTSVYPLGMFIRVIIAQVIIMFMV